MMVIVPAVAVVVIMIVLMIVVVFDGLCLGLRFASHVRFFVAPDAAAQDGSLRTEEHGL